MGKENYYQRQAREAHEAVERRSRDAHSSMQQRMHGKQPDARDTPQYKQGGEGDSSSEPTPKPKSKTKAKGEAAAAVSSNELTMVTFYSLASALGAVAAAALLGRRGHNN